MRVRIPLAVGTAAVVALGVTVASAPAASASAAACRPSISVLPLPTWAVSGAVNDAVPGTAVGVVTVKNGTTRAMRWQRSGARWKLSPIPGVAALGPVPSSSATGVNRHGAITVSVSAGVSGAPRAFVAADGLLHPLLDGAGGTSAYAADIGDSGLVVGSAYSVPEYRSFAVRWDFWDQAPRALGYGGGSSSSAEAVDDNDDIGGWTFGTPNSGGAAFRVDGDGATMPLGGVVGAGGPSNGVVTDLNPSERTVGRYQSSVGQGAAVWDDGVQQILPRFVGGRAPYATSATAVSNSGVVVGYEDERAGSESPLVRHVLVWTDTGGARSLLLPNGRWTDPATANAVDDAGTVYGASYSTSLSQHPGQMVPTAWTCAVAQSFVPTATGVPASAPRPDVVIEQG